MKITKQQIKQIIKEVLEEQARVPGKSWKITFQDDVKLPEPWSVEVSGFDKKNALEHAVAQFELEFDSPPIGVNVSIVPVNSSLREEETVSEIIDNGHKFRKGRMVTDELIEPEKLDEAILYAEKVVELLKHAKKSETRVGMMLLMNSREYSQQIADLLSVLPVPSYRKIK